jgi:GT2 family glycosyltransferase
MTKSYIIIPIHNRKETTLKCLAVLSSQNLTNCQIVVVDDGSTDGSETAIKTNFPEVVVLKGDGNLWWTGAICLGMQYSVAQGADYLFWLNDDCLPADNCLEIMVHYLQNYSPCMIGANCIDLITQESIETGFMEHKRVKVNGDEIIDVDGLSGFLVGMSSVIPKQIGYPDARKFPHYASDSIYTLIAKRAGYPVRILGKAIAYITDYTNPAISFREYVLQTGIKSWHFYFRSPKTSYRLATRFFYYTIKKGFLRGLIIFLMQGLSWNLTWLWLTLTHAKNSHRS